MSGVRVAGVPSGAGQTNKKEFPAIERQQKRERFDQPFTKLLYKRVAIGSQVVKVLPEMEKHADGADASVLFFPLCCANFLAVYMKNS